MLDARFNVSNNVLDGVGVMCIYDTFANLKTAGNLLNSQSIVLLGIYKVDEADFKGQAILEMPTVIASEFAAVRALRLTHNANLALYVPGTTNGARDSFGGPALASMPYFNTPFYELPISTLKHEFTDEEQTELNTTGISLLDNNTANNRVIAGEVVTTYKTDFGGNPDHTYKYLNAVDTASNIREYFFNNLKAKYAQTRLTQGDLVPNRNMANAESIKAYLVGLYTDLSGENYVLTQAGEAARKFFIDNCTVEIDMEEGQVTIIMKTPIVVQLRSIIATMQIAFSTQG